MNTTPLEMDATMDNKTLDVLLKKAGEIPQNKEEKLYWQIKIKPF